jgi:hypothetical protein
MQPSEVEATLDALSRRHSTTAFLACVPGHMFALQWWQGAWYVLDSAREGPQPIAAGCHPARDVHGQGAALRLLVLRRSPDSPLALGRDDGPPPLIIPPQFVYGVPLLLAPGGATANVAPLLLRPAAPTHAATPAAATPAPVHVPPVPARAAAPVAPADAPIVRAVFGPPAVHGATAALPAVAARAAPSASVVPAARPAPVAPAAPAVPTAPSPAVSPATTTHGAPGPSAMLVACARPPSDRHPPVSAAPPPPPAPLAASSATPAPVPGHVAPIAAGVHDAHGGPTAYAVPRPQGPPAPAAGGRRRGRAATVGQPSPAPRATQSPPTVALGATLTLGPGQQQQPACHVLVGV